MGNLVPFIDPELKPPKPLQAPPEDSLERADWLHTLLCNELDSVMRDGSLTKGQRREYVLKYGKAIIQATPNHELQRARAQVLDDEKETQSTPKLTGKVAKSVSKGSAGRLRASAPRRRKDS